MKMQEGGEGEGGGQKIIINSAVLKSTCQQ